MNKICLSTKSNETKKNKINTMDYFEQKRKYQFNNSFIISSNNFTYVKIKTEGNEMNRTIGR